LTLYTLSLRMMPLRHLRMFLYFDPKIFVFWLQLI